MDSQQAGPEDPLPGELDQRSYGTMSGLRQDPNPPSGAGEFPHTFGDLGRGAFSMKTTVTIRFKAAEIECVWEYQDEPDRSQFAIPSIGQMRPGMAIPYNWKPISLRVVQE